MSESMEVRSEDSVSASDPREVRVEAGEREDRGTNNRGLEELGETTLSSDEDGSEGGKDCGVLRPFGVSHALYQADSSRLSCERVVALISGFSSHWKDGPHTN